VGVGGFWGVGGWGGGGVGVGGGVVFVGVVWGCVVGWCGFACVVGGGVCGRCVVGVGGRVRGVCVGSGLGGLMLWGGSV